MKRPLVPLLAAAVSQFGGDDDDSLLRMSFLEHLEELRTRILRALSGFGVVFLLCAVFSQQLFQAVLAPGEKALRNTGGHFVAIDVFERFSIVWVWTPVVAAIFLASPWVLYQAWAFISPGLYEREKKWAVPFILCTAGLFIAGGLFGYFVAFPYTLTFLLGVGGTNVVSEISIERYFDRFVDTMLGIGVVFELPILIFFLVLIRVASPSFLLNHARYAIIGIVILAAVITPSPDAFTQMLFAVPMCLLFFLGIFASHLLVLRRENRRFPWKPFLIWCIVGVMVIGAALVLAVRHRL